MSNSYPVDTNTVRKNGMRGVISSGAGIGLLLVKSLIGIPYVGWIIGGGLTAVGLLGLFGKTKTDKATGVLLAGAGIVSLALKGLAGFVLGASGIGLLGFGAYNLFKFFKGLKSRS